MSILDTINNFTGLSKPATPVPQYLQPVPKTPIYPTPTGAKPTAASPGATSPVLKSPAAQKFVQNQLKGSSSPTQFKQPVDNSPQLPPTPIGAQSTPQSAPTAPQTPTPDIYSPTQAYTDAFKAYQDALGNNTGVNDASTAYNDFIANQSKSVAGLEGQGRGIPLTLIRGQQQKLLDQTTPEATRLQNAISIAQGGQTNAQNAAKAGLDYQTTLQSLAQQRATAQTEADKTAYQKTQDAQTQANADRTFNENIKEFGISEANKIKAAEIAHNGRVGGALDTTPYTAGANPIVDAYIANINSGKAKLQDYAKSPYYNQIQEGIAQASGSATDIVNITKSALSNLQSMVDNNQGFSSAVGKGKGILSGGLFGVFGGKDTLGGGAGTARANFNAALIQVKSGVLLPNLNILKGLGRVTQTEFNTLGQAITDLSTNQSEPQFKKSLKTITDIIDEKARQATTSTSSNQSSGGTGSYADWLKTING